VRRRPLAGRQLDVERRAHEWMDEAQRGARVQGAGLDRQAFAPGAAQQRVAQARGVEVGPGRGEQDQRGDADV